MHVQTIPKSPPKIIVQVAEVVTFFLQKIIYKKKALSIESADF
jgi:hypothetical protein